MSLSSDRQGKRPVSWRDDRDTLSDNNLLCAAAGPNISILWHHVTWPQLQHVETNKEYCSAAKAYGYTRIISRMCCPVIQASIRYNVIYYKVVTRKSQLLYYYILLLLHYCCHLFFPSYRKIFEIVVVNILFWFVYFLLSLNSNVDVQNIS